MLLFITPKGVYFIAERNFNTSHVTVYPVVRLIVMCMGLFQYIPCYCLSCVRFWKSIRRIISIHPMLLFIDFRPLFSLYIQKFQYIPCYCLSCSKFIISIKIPQFQYIPCYCLSSTRWIPFKKFKISIHPMLLFI